MSEIEIELMEEQKNKKENSLNISDEEKSLVNLSFKNILVKKHQSSKKEENLQDNFIEEKSEKLSEVNQEVDKKNKPLKFELEMEKEKMFENEEITNNIIIIEYTGRKNNIKFLGNEKVDLSPLLGIIKKSLLIEWNNSSFYSMLINVIKGYNASIVFCSKHKKQYEKFCNNLAKLYNIDNILYENTTNKSITDIEAELRENLQKLNQRFEGKNILNDSKIEEIEVEETNISHKFNHFIVNELFKNKKIYDFYNQKNKKTFSITVMATMSSGKSTFINALLSKKLMPSQNEACTSVITEIISDDRLDDYILKIDENNEIKTKIADYETLFELNKNNINSIEINGKIPFISTNNDYKVKIIDTPGPNNSRNDEHSFVTYNRIEEKFSDLYIYLLNVTQLATFDDKEFLENLVKKLKEENDRVEDRILFVVNKLDQIDVNNEDISILLSNVYDYLSKEIGIKNPKIFPISALLGLNLRTEIDYIDIDNLTREEYRKLSRTTRETINILETFIDYDEMHLEKYAFVSNNVKNIINSKLANAKKKNDVKEIGLIYSGIVSLEEAILEYINKYYLELFAIDIYNFVDKFLEIELDLNKENLKDIIDMYNNLGSKLKNGYNEFYKINNLLKKEKNFINNKTKNLEYNSDNLIYIEDIIVFINLINKIKKYLGAKIEQLNIVKNSNNIDKFEEYINNKKEKNEFKFLKKDELLDFNNIIYFEEDKNITNDEILNIVDDKLDNYNAEDSIIKFIDNVLEYIKEVENKFNIIINKYDIYYILEKYGICKNYNKKIKTMLLDNKEYKEKETFSDKIKVFNSILIKDIFNILEKEKEILNEINKFIINEYLKYLNNENIKIEYELSKYNYLLLEAIYLSNKGELV